MFANQPEFIPILFIFILVCMMLTMSINLYLKLRSRLFIILSSSFLAATIAPFVTMIQSVFSTSSPSLIILTLSKVSYLLVLMGVYHLYKPKQFKELRIYIAASVATLIVCAFSIIASSVITAIIIVAIALGITGYGIYIVSPLIGKKYMYVTALLFYSAASVLEIFSTLVYIDAIVFISLSLQVLFYFLIFIIFFERIIDILQAASYKSITDGLTRVYNKTYFIDQVNKKMQTTSQISVIFCDIDNFKKLNDTKGHEEGDKVLIQVASIVDEVVKEHGIAARYGGEEIVALLHHPDADPGEIAEKIRKRVESETIVTLSIGYSTRNTAITEQPIIKEADTALYEAKNSGKNKVVQFRHEANIE